VAKNQASFGFADLVAKDHSFNIAAYISSGAVRSSPSLCSDCDISALLFVRLGWF
jgi:hypothetical protein